MHVVRSARSLALALIVALGGACDSGDPAEQPPLDMAPAPDMSLALDMSPDMPPAPDAGPDMAPAPDMSPDMAPDPPPARFEQLDRCLEDVIAGSPASGAAVVVVERGALAHAAGLGHRNDPDATPVEPSTLFRFASILKGMTALALFTEVEAGNLDVQTPVAELLPALAEHADPRWQTLTVHHLLTHQGGFADYGGVQAPGEPDSVLGEVVESAAFAEAAYFMVDPGTFYNYANPNYMLAGRVLEVLTGQSYREAMQARVFAPLGMQRAMFRPVDVIADGDYARGSSVDPESGSAVPVPADAYDSVWGRPAGMGWASALDLARYVQFVIDGGHLGDDLDPEPWLPPVGPETWQAWRAEQIEAESHLIRYGAAHGLIIGQGFYIERQYHPITTVGHDGNLQGYTSVMLTAPELDLGALVLINSDFLNGPLHGCLNTLLTTSEAAPGPAEPPVRWPDPQTLGDYVGTFDGGPWLGTIIISLDEAAGLVLDLPDAAAEGIPFETTVLPFARDVFVVDIYDYQRFVTGIRLAPDEPVHYLRSRYFVGHRVDEAPQQKRRRALDVEPLRRPRLLSEPLPPAADPRR